MKDIADLRFLVVEDHGFQRWLIVELLQQLGASSVHAAGDGQAAIEVLSRDRSIDIVVSDLDMPGMDGMELFRHMSQLGHRAGLLVVSAMEPAVLASVEAMAREYRLNVLGTVRKPLNAKKFEDAVGRYRTSAPAPATGTSQPVAREEIAAGLKRGEFEAFFQPQAEIRSCHLQGAEALVRWRHPYRGYLSPAVFLDAVEAGGLIDELTTQVMRQALAAYRGWRHQWPNVGVSVNLSAQSLSNVDLAERMIALAAEGDVEPMHITFEVTESAAARDLGSELENLARIRMRGFELSIDDYGTGYSSLHRLSRIAFTELKIEQAFVRKAVSDDASRVMVESSLELANRLGMRAIAEGVESKVESDMLLALGCQYIQGNLIAEPMPAGEFLAWLENRQANCA
jgi:EAL domain-containing protein (putative c-di-GMP-specific phosphodiesterase class I)